MASSAMEQSLPDLVRDSKLETQIFTDHTVQTVYVSDPTTGQRCVPIEQRWHVAEQLGSGSFGVVYLEKCVSGPALGQVRAVKQLRKGGSNASNYARELEAIAKFSHEKVRRFFRRQSYILTGDSIDTVSSAHSAGTRLIAPSSLPWNTFPLATCKISLTLLSMRPKHAKLHSNY
jgi:hypothetical protein